STGRCRAGTRARRTGTGGSQEGQAGQRGGQQPGLPGPGPPPARVLIAVGVVAVHVVLPSRRGRSRRAAVVRAGQLRKRIRAGGSSRALRARFATADHVVIWLVSSETVLNPPAGHAGGRGAGSGSFPPGPRSRSRRQTDRACQTGGVYSTGETVRVLVVEDHAEMAETVAGGLRRAHLAGDGALDGPCGLDRALTNGYDVIVLDRDLPGMHGDEICAELVAAGCRSRVLMLTAAAANEDLVDGLGLGADDYLPKPF